MASKDDSRTHQIRVFADIGEMVAWVARIEQTTTAQLLDPLIRASITARYAKHEELIKEMQEAEKALRAAEEKARQRAKENQESESSPKPKGKKKPS